MGLVLTLKPNERIMIGDVVAYIEPSKDKDTAFRMIVGEEEFDITDKKGTEVLPDVIVSAGDYNPDFLQYRVMFNAPRSIPILREEVLNQCHD